MEAKVRCAQLARDQENHEIKQGNFMMMMNHLVYYELSKILKLVNIKMVMLLN